MQRKYVQHELEAQIWELLTHSLNTKHLMVAPWIPETDLGLQQNKYP